MALQFRSQITAVDQSGSTGTINTPAGIQVGDLMILQIGVSGGGTGAPIVDAGWHEIPRGYIAGGDSIFLYAKTVAPSEPASVGMSHNLSNTKSMAITAWYSDTAAGVWIDVVANQSNSSSTNRSFPSVTASAAAILLCFGVIASNLSSTPDAAMVERWDTGSGVRLYLMSQSVSSGATGTRTATGGSAVASKVVSLAIIETTPTNFIGPQFRGFSSNAIASLSSPQTISPPSNIQAGDLMIIQTAFNTEPTTVTTPTGWTLEEVITGSDDIYTFSKIAGVAEGSASLVWTGGNRVMGLAMHAWYSPAGEDLYIDASAQLDNTSSTNRTLPSVTTTKANAGLAMLTTVANNNGGTPAITAMERYDTGAGPRLYLMTELVFSAGATGTRIFTGTIAAASRSVTLAVAERDFPGDPTAPAAASSLVATAISGTQIDLTWADDSTGEDGFSIERKTGIGGTYAEIATVGANVESYSDTTVAENTTYYYRIRAFVGVVYSGYSNVANETTPADFSAPADVTATALGPRRIRIEWTDPNTNELGYLVERSFFADDGFVQIASLAAGAIQYTDTGLEPETTYYYRVRGYK